MSWLFDLWFDHKLCVSSLQLSVSWSTVSMSTLTTPMHRYDLLAVLSWLHLYVKRTNWNVDVFHDFIKPLTHHSYHFFGIKIWYCYANYCHSFYVVHHVNKYSCVVVFLLLQRRHFSQQRDISAHFVFIIIIIKRCYRYITCCILWAARLESLF